MKQDDQTSPLAAAQTKYITLCKERYGDDPTLAQTKEVLQELIDAEHDFHVKFAFTQIWHLAKDYHS